MNSEVGDKSLRSAWFHCLSSLMRDVTAAWRASIPPSLPNNCGSEEMEKVEVKISVRSCFVLHGYTG